jgi:hypothetical protein
MLTLSGRVVAVDSREWEFSGRTGVTRTLHVAADGQPPTSCKIPESLVRAHPELLDQLAFGTLVQVVVRPFVKVSEDRPPYLTLTATNVYVVEAAPA